MSEIGLSAATKNPATCEHSRSEVRYVDAANGQRQYKKQCLECGRGVTPWLKHKDVPSKHLAPPWDDGLRESGQALAHKWYAERDNSRLSAYEEAKDQAREQWRAWYSSYLESPRWAATRGAVLHRALGLCEGCRACPPQIVHHLTYDNVGDELLFQLVALCRPCHKRAHAKTERSSWLPEYPDWSLTMKQEGGAA